MCPHLHLHAHMELFPAAVSRCNKAQCMPTDRKLGPKPILHRHTRANVGTRYANSNQLISQANFAVCPRTANSGRVIGKILQAGQIIRRGIERGIADADYLIALLSNNAIDTIQGWIGFELDQAYERERIVMGRSHYFVIPVVLEKGLNIPGWLSAKVYVDMTIDFKNGVKRIAEAVSANIPE